LNPSTTKERKREREGGRKKEKKKERLYGNMRDKE
jgi:hypothetical protein